jgi:hypothetical protein
MNRSGWAIVPGMAETPDEALIALLRQRGFTFDAGRAAALLPLAEQAPGRAMLRRRRRDSSRTSCGER